MSSNSVSARSEYARSLAQSLGVSIALLACASNPPTDQRLAPTTACTGDTSCGGRDSGPSDQPISLLAMQRCAIDRDCDDGVFCNGAERCSITQDDDAGADSRMGICQPAAALPCPTQACDEASQRCDCDADGDGLAAWFCGGPDDDADGDSYRWNDAVHPDCDDRDRFTYPNQTEVCDYQGHDEDCDLTTVAGKSNDADPLRDKDGDDYVDIACINLDPKTGEIHHYTGERAPDCNDDNPEIHPGPDVQDNTCDDRDNDCDGRVDEQAPFADFCPDRDGDGSPAAGPVFKGCGPLPGYLPCRAPADCDETPQTGAKVAPGQPEICDGVDNDCDPNTPRDQAPPGELLSGEPTFSDGTEAICDQTSGAWRLNCPPGRAWCDKRAIARGCETDVTQLTRCRSCDATQCTFACGQQGCDEIVQVSLGREFACAVTNEGRVACWGRGGEGRLGNDDPRSSSIPSAVVGLTGAKSVAAGTAHACAIAGADSTVYCWGSDDSGQLANPDSSSFSAAPVPVVGLPGGSNLYLSSAAQLAAGDQHTCAVMQDHTLVCWGETEGGRLGDGTVDAGTRTTASVSRLVDYPPYGLLQFPVDNAAQVTAGEQHSCLTTIDGNVECWGSNAYGQLAADGSTSQSAAPLPVAGLANVTQISAGANHTCALVSKRVFCWGLNSDQQLGRPSATTDSIPTAILGLPDVVEVAAGYNFTCAKTADGLVYCWGANSGAQLGFLDDPLGVDAGAPAEAGSGSPVVIALGNVADIVASQFVCALARDTKVSCWGFNRFGQLGRGTTSLEAEPLALPIQPIMGSK
jgi:alpha-tubulin suppressor-like RCC1 family protein